MTRRLTKRLDHSLVLNTRVGNFIAHHSQTSFGKLLLALGVRFARSRQHERKRDAPQDKTATVASQKRHVQTFRTRIENCRYNALGGNPEKMGLDIRCSEKRSFISLVERWHAGNAASASVGMTTTSSCLVGLGWHKLT